MSERRACHVLAQSRSSQRRAPVQPTEEEVLLRARIVEIASGYGRYGYRRVTGRVRLEGWSANPKRVARIWREEGLKLPQKQPRRTRLWLGDGSRFRLRPQHRNHVWAYDFAADQPHDGRPIRMLTIVDAFTRECLVIRVERKLQSKHVLEVLGSYSSATAFPSTSAVTTAGSFRRRAFANGSRESA